MKKIFTRLLMAAVLLMCAQGAKATIISYIDATSGLQYELDDATMTAALTSGANTTTVDITIPSSVTYSGKSFTVNEIRGNAFCNLKEITSVTIPSSVETIGSWAFASCSKLATVTIPDGVKYLKFKCFYFTAITQITIPSTVVEVEDYAFYGCTKLSSVTIKNGVKILGDKVFTENQLTQVKLPASIERISGLTFHQCTKLQKFEVDAGNPYLAVDRQMLCSKDFTTLYSCPPALSITNLQIYNGVKTIKAGAFSYNQNIETLRLPASVSIEDVDHQTGLFTLWMKLNHIEIWGDNPKYVSMGGVLYSKDMSELLYYPRLRAATEYKVIDKVIKIAPRAFNNVKNVDKITLPSTLTTIGDSAFYTANIKEITIPKGVKQFGEHMFYNCLNLNSVILQEGITTIPSKTFAYCYLLKQMVIPHGATSIGSSALQRCYNLEEVVIPASMETIEKSAFAGCTQLKKVECQTEDPINIESSVFENVDLANAVLYVPVGCKEAYEAASVWQEFGTIKEKYFYTGGTKGDINNDGVVNVGDVTALINQILGN
ncbi:MAG: leucine-rich repeat protein [Bacteroidales bacterium]|nr:leucine-rich repeat protein [Bacteroidales bacterium]